MREGWAAVVLLLALCWPLAGLAQDEPAAEPEAELVLTDPPALADRPGEAVETDRRRHSADCHCECCCAELGLYAGPLAAVNTHPPNAMFLSPSPEAATVLREGSEFWLNTDWTSIIVRELDSGIIADYDMEIVRVTPEWRSASGQGEVFARLPLTWRGVGIQDGIIRSWHGWFGLPNALRDVLPDSEYSYVMVSRDGPVHSDTGGAGIGDLVVGYKHPLQNKNDGRRAAAVRAQVKLPTGNRALALSSGNVDVSVGALYQRQLTRRLRGYANYDLVFVGEPDLENVGWQDHHVYLLALEYSHSPATSFVAQFQHHGNPLVLGSYEADKDPHQISLGMQRRMPGRLLWSVGFTEDLRPETAPDFTIHSHLRWSF